MKQTFQMHLYQSLNWDDEPGDFRLIPWAPEAHSTTFGLYVGPVEVTADVPEDFDSRAAKLAAKQAELQKVRAEFTKRITELQGQISRLTAIEAQA